MKINTPKESLRKMIIPKLVAYIQAASTWHDEGKYDCIVDGIGLEMIELETEILGKFGLPAEVYYFTNILQQAVFSDLKLTKNTAQLFERLRQEAISYLSSPTTLNTTQLAEAKRSNKIAQDVLPLMGIYCTTYTSFLYNEYYLVGHYTEEELLVELNFAQAYHIEKKRIIPYSLDQMRDGNCYQRLLNDKLPHAKEFYEYLAYDTEIHLWDIEPNACDDGIFLEEQTTLRLHEFYISTIEITNMQTCVMKILVPMPEGLHNVNLWCNVKMCRAMLKFARYYSQAVTLDLNVYYNGEYEWPLSYNLFKEQGHNLEINKCTIQIERMDDEDDDSGEDIENPFNYYLVAIITEDAVLCETF